MTYTRPSFIELKARIETDLAAMPAVLRGPLSASWARACHGQHGFLDWILAQCSPLTCELERLYDWSALYGVYRLSATAATGYVLATGTVNSVLLAATVLRGQNGLDYVVLSAVTLGSNATPVSVRCVEAGSASNLVAGQTLTLVDPVPGVSNTLTVGADGINGGAEVETVEDWRARVADEWRTIVTRGARSGKVEDYRYWAKTAHPSVTTALVQPHVLGLGSVIVRPICNSLANRLPTAAVIDAVSAALLDIAPATADWRVVAPLVHAVAISIHLLPGYDTAEHRAAIEAALAALVFSEYSESSLLAMAEIDAAIATVTTQYTRIAPLADIAIGAGEVFVLQAPVWVV